MKQEVKRGGRRTAQIHDTHTWCGWDEVRVRQEGATFFKRNWHASTLAFCLGMYPPRPVQYALHPVALPLGPSSAFTLATVANDAAITSALTGVNP